MTTQTTYKPDAFDDMHKILQTRFEGALTIGGQKLFTTDAAGLFETYLSGFSEADRQHHNCNCCRRFIERFGGLVVINEAGQQFSAMWTSGEMPEHYQPSLELLRKAVNRARVNGVFVSDKADLGQHHEGGWTHFSVKLPAAMVYRQRVPKAHEVEALKKQDFGTLSHALADFDAATVGKAMDILNSDALYRGDRVSGPIKFLRDLHAKLADESLIHNRKDNTIWRAVAGAPAGYCTPRSAAAGALLTDLKSGLDFESVKRRFGAMMAPSNFGRAQTAPTAGNLRVAEKLVADLGIENSLKRRYAGTDELPKLWAPRKAKPAQAAPGGVFGHIATRDKAAPAAAALEIPAKLMTWDKFARSVLPGAVSIELQVPAATNRFAALVTAEHPDAPPILAWDREEARNPVSWYYATGIDAEMKRRVEGAGGQYENVDVRASLLWNDTNDLDLVCYSPFGERIFYGHKRDRTGGYLDVDMNAFGGLTTKPVENVRWPKGTARPGAYRVAVWNYTDRNRSKGGTPFRLELEVGGKVFTVTGTVPYGRIQQEQGVVEFQLGPNAQIIGQPHFTGADVQRSDARNAWDLVTGAFVPVTGIVESPNLWGDKPMPHYGRHTFFLLEGCKDDAAGVGRGFFVETLKSELHAARRTLEAFTASAPIGPAIGDPACGLGMSDQAPWNIVLRAKTESTVQAYKIDRWD